jgi:hypothetical protein
MLESRLFRKVSGQAFVLNDGNTWATEVAPTVAKSTFVDYFAQPTEVGFAMR